MAENKTNKNEIKEHTFEDLQESYFEYITNQQDRDKIKEAYEYAKEKHEGQFRKSGEPYICHPLEVAYIISKLHGGPSTIEAGLLHDVVEDTDATIEDIKDKFGNDVALLVDSLTKIQRLKLSKKKDIDFDAEDHRKILLGMAKDIRVIIVKLADRLHNLRTLDSLSPDRQVAMAKDTLEIYAPIAHRLGMYKIKSELEDLSLKYIEPDIYNYISNLLDQRTKNRKKSLDNLKKKIADLLYEAKIPFQIESRIKSIYSIYKKIYVKMHNFDDIYDILALRIITETELNCYEILGIIHATYKPVPGRFKDYIAVPKPNMYQSLHTTIMAGDGNVFEVQIRTKEMDEVAETGIAAHWRYKEGSNYNPKQEQKEIEEKLHWFRDFLQISNDSKKSTAAQEYLSNLSKDIFEANVYVFTPKGKVVDLPNGSTPIDFAYKIHTKVGDTASGAVVNGVLVPLNTVLKTADIVEIKTNPNSPGPSEGWLKFAKTATAINRIKKFIAKKNSEYQKDDKIKIGKQGLIDCFREAGISENDTINLISTNKVLNNYHFSTIDELYVGVANHNPLPSAILSFLNLNNKKTRFKLINKNKKQLSNIPVTVKNVDDVAITLANCCSPIPGDDIVGYITKGRGITVHRKNCPNIVHEKERLIEVEWKQNLGLGTYPVDISISSNDRKDLLVDLMNLFSINKIAVSKLNAKSFPDTMIATFTATIYVSDAKTLQDIFNMILNIKGVFEVKRIIH